MPGESPAPPPPSASVVLTAAPSRIESQLEVGSPSGMSHSLRRSMLLVGWGIFVSTFTQTFGGLIADLPLRDLLQERVGALKMATFFAVAMSPWYFKPIAGLLSDAFPLFGTRRKSYMIAGAIAAGALWLLLGFVPHQYSTMLIVATLMNIGLVVVSSATAGLLVEDGQRLGATGRLTSARIVVMSSCFVFGGALGGLLAQHHQFRLTSIVCGAVIFSLVPTAWGLLDEPRSAARDVRVLQSAWGQVKLLARSRTMWAAAGMLFLIDLSPGFQTPLYDHLTRDLGFSRQFIGWMQSAKGLAGILAAILYGLLCGRLKLRVLLALSLACAAAGVLPFLFLHTRSEGVLAYATWGFGAFLAQLAALDLAARASPRGVEAMGYALIVSAYNISLNLSDVSGSWLWGRLHHHFDPLVLINAGSTLVLLLVIPFLPGVLVEGREGEVAVGD